MKLHLSKPVEKNIFSGYGSGYVVVNNKKYENSMITMPDKIIEDWQASTVEKLTEEHFKLLIPYEPEIILLGTGATLRFPSLLVTKNLLESKIGFEVMDTNAACRTYNILMAEGRNVAAALLI
ncbi:MAG: Xcc1710-like domain-containing protein [Nitrosomonadaceae bacterium]|nr:Xcc1710-like domain-containing protein [Nitrosomonadaceae bacterium]